MTFLGFSGGLPFLLVFSTLTAWLTEGNVSRSTIGFFAWIGITYSTKVLWAPVVDSVPVPFLTKILGQRRSWMLIGQIGIAFGLVLMSLIGPSDLLILSFCAFLVAFSSATQDVAIDAFRIESAEPEYQGAMSAAYVFGYRLALLAAGAGALYLAEYFSWTITYIVMASLMLVGVVTVLLVAEPDRQSGSFPLELSAIGLRRWFTGAVAGPFVDFFSRNGKVAFIILLFIAVFRLSDIAMGIMANPFYLDMGYTKTEIANVAKVFGFFMSIAGSLVCGVLVVKWGLMRPLLIGAVAVAVTNLLFASLSVMEPRVSYLAVVISADNVSGGFAATAFIAYLSSLTNRAYTATQYALFSSLMTLPGKFISGFSGLVVDNFGYLEFFVVAAMLGIPAILLVIWLSRHERRQLASQP
ncbi:MAG: MFS transporter [Proteobacteria bacterium]|nr:MFS transporter [Pseudomonadota bacterium]